MASFSARRGTERDQGALSRLCIEAPMEKGSVWSVRRPLLDPTAWFVAHAPVVVVGEGTSIVGFAIALLGNVPLAAPRTAEALAYVSPGHRRHGAARAAMTELLSVARQVGLWKLVAHALPQDVGAHALLGRLDFRAVGVLAKHIQIDGGWQDVVVSERLVLAARKSFPSVSDA